jgi:hypothetical protein
MSDFRYLWIFHVVGGEACKVQVDGNPTMKHDGNRSVLRCLCTDTQAEVIVQAFKDAGASVETNSPREAPEQTEERENLFAVLGGDTEAWPTPNCPNCAWFDHQVEGLCGAGMLAWKGLPGWGPDVVAQRLAGDKHAQDYKSCPLSSLLGKPHDN